MYKVLIGLDALFPFVEPVVGNVFLALAEEVVVFKAYPGGEMACLQQCLGDDDAKMGKAVLLNDLGVVTEFEFNEKRALQKQTL